MPLSSEERMCQLSGGVVRGVCKMGVQRVREGSEAFLSSCSGHVEQWMCFDPPDEYRPFVVMEALIALAKVAQLIHQATPDLCLGKS